MWALRKPIILKELSLYDDGGEVWVMDKRTGGSLKKMGEIRVLN